MTEEESCILFQTKLPIDFQCTIDSVERSWRGVAKIPLEYLPPGVKKFNAYAIHGSGDNRTYEALYEEDVISRSILNHTPWKYITK